MTVHYTSIYSESFLFYTLNTAWVLLQCLLYTQRSYFNKLGCGHQLHRGTFHREFVNSKTFLSGVSQYMYVWVCVCVCLCVRACVRACVHASVCVCQQDGLVSCCVYPTHVVVCVSPPPQLWCALLVFTVTPDLCLCLLCNSTFAIIIHMRLSITNDVCVSNSLTT